MKNIYEMTAKELKARAKELKVKGWWDLNKEALIKEIEKIEAAEAKEKEILDARKNSVATEAKAKGVRMMTAAEIAKLNGKEAKVRKIEKVEAAEAKKIEKIEAGEDGKLVAKRGGLIEYDGKAMNICAWAKEVGISANTLYGRLYKMGWSIEKALTTKK